MLCGGEVVCFTYLVTDVFIFASHVLRFSSDEPSINKTDRSMSFLWIKEGKLSKGSFNVFPIKTCREGRWREKLSELECCRERYPVSTV